MKRHSYNLTNTSMACQGLCSKIMQNYAKNLLQKLKHQKQFALILKPNPCYTIMKLKHNLISIVRSGYQSKWCSIQWMHQWEAQPDQFKKWSLTCWNKLEGDLRHATNTLYFTTSESYILPISHNTLKKKNETWDISK